MCGVPIERADDYLNRLIALGHRVAVCEQIEDPAEAKKRGAKSVVKREVIRLVTPGTITEDRLLEPGRSRLLVAVQRIYAGEARWTYGLAALDLDRRLRVVGDGRGGASPSSLACSSKPSEIVAAQAVFDEPMFQRLVADLGAPARPLAREAGEGSAAERRVREFFGVETLDGFGRFTRAEVAAAALALGYVKRTQFEARPSLSPPISAGAARRSKSTRRPAPKSELTRVASGGCVGLAPGDDRSHRDATGARLLAERLASPLTDPGRNQRAARFARFHRGGTVARELAPGPGGRASFPPGAVAPQSRPRRSARPRRRRSGPGAAAGALLRLLEAADDLPPELLAWAIAPSSIATAAGSNMILLRRWRRICRCSSATAVRFVWCAAARRSARPSR